MVERMRDPEEVVGEWLDFVALWIFQQRQFALLLLLVSCMNYRVYKIQ